MSLFTYDKFHSPWKHCTEHEEGLKDVLFKLQHNMPGIVDWAKQLDTSSSW